MTFLDEVLGGNFLGFTHGDLVDVGFLLSEGEVIYRLGWIGTSRQQVEHWLIWVALCEELVDSVVGWHGVLVAQHLSDKLVRCKDSSIFTDSANEAKVEEMADVLVSADLLLEVRHSFSFWFGFFEESSPFLLHPSNSLWKFLEEWLVLVGESMSGKSQDVQPRLVLHPH